MRTFLYISLILSLSAPAYSATSATKKHKKKPKAAVAKVVAVPVDPYTPTPLDKLQEELHKRFKSVPARALGKASDAFDKKKFTLARTLADQAINSSFGDLAKWVSAGAQKKEAEQALASKKFAKANDLAAAARAKLLTIEAMSPYSPVLHAIPKEISGDELIQAKTRVAMKNPVEAKALFESAFQRVSNVGQFSLMTIEDTLPYAKLCIAKNTGLCENWLMRISQNFSKNPRDLKLLQAVFQQASERSKTNRTLPKNTQSYPGPNLDTAAFEAAMIAVEDKKYSTAIPALRQFIDEFPKSTFRFRARFWLAQCLDRDKRAKDARLLYQDLERDTPLSFYGLVAAIKNHEEIADHLEAQVPLGMEKDNNLGPAEAFHLDRAQKLISEKAFELASLELKEIHAKDSLSSPFLAYLAMINAEAKNYNGAFALLSELGQRGFEGFASSYITRLIFPIENYDVIKKAAAENRVDPVLVLSLIKQESGFDHKISSSVGAMGLMQLMSYTAIETKADLNPEDLEDPAVNIDVGTRYLKKLLTRFDGNIVFALAAYNAGPNAVDRWIKEQGLKGKPGSVGMLDFMEAIPYHETKDYVSSIIRNYFWYVRRLNLEKKDLEYFWTES